MKIVFQSDKNGARIVAKTYTVLTET